MKNIWIVNHYATLEDEPATRSYDFAKKLVKKGYKTTILASSFSHYKFQEKKNYRRKKYLTEEHEGVKFIWIKTFPYYRNNWRRVFNMIIFSWRVFYVGRKLEEKPNIIIGVSVHPLAALSAYFLAKNKNSRFFLEITDLWPEILIDMGIVSKKSPVVFILRKLEKFLFDRAEKIITLWPLAYKYIEKLGFPKEKVTWIPHFVDFVRFTDLRPYDGGINKKIFKFIYSGIHSDYANLETVIEAASILQKENEKRVKFIFVGNGSEKLKLVRMAEELKLENLEFMDMIPKTEIYKVLNEADALIFTLKNMPLLLKYGISSNKLIDYLAAGRPLIFSANSDNNPVKEARAGITVSAQNSKDFVLAVKNIINLKPEQRFQMGQNARKYAEKYHDLNILVKKLEDLWN
jgi:glycosyltransferase involved in cell wall biosynthesis